MNNRNIAFISLIALAIATRFIPHVSNFTAVGAVALFGGAMFKDGLKAFLVPLLALFLSDLVINNVMYASFYEGFQWVTPGFGAIYGGFLVAVLIGRLTIKSFKPLPIASAGVVSTLAFFLITNFGSWLANPIYIKDFSGLLTSYTAGLPFLGNQLIGTLAYSAILFGAAYFWLGSKETTLANNA
jgi:hypothetical protein